jgi:methanogenic corrinoid protein MtbC1
VAQLSEVAREIASGVRVKAAIAKVCGNKPTTVRARKVAKPLLSGSVAQATDKLLDLDLAGLRGVLQKSLSKHSVPEFAQRMAVPLMQEVGQLWQQGRLPVYGEHLFSGVLEQVLHQICTKRQAIRLHGPRILLATPSGEMHGLGLALVNAVLYDAGFNVTFLPGHLPVQEIALAVKAFSSDVVALSVSVVYPPKMLKAQLRTLRAALPRTVEVWVGGAGTHRVANVPEGVRVMTNIEDALTAAQAWDGTRRAAQPDRRTAKAAATGTGRT